MRIGLNPGDRHGPGGFRVNVGTDFDYMKSDDRIFRDQRRRDDYALRPYY
jgi:hypothetical protein